MSHVNDERWLGMFNLTLVLLVLFEMVLDYCVGMATSTRRAHLFSPSQVLFKDKYAQWKVVTIREICDGAVMTDVVMHKAAKGDGEVCLAATMIIALLHNKLQLFHHTHTQSRKVSRGFRHSAVRIVCSNRQMVSIGLKNTEAHTDPPCLWA